MIDSLRMEFDIKKRHATVRKIDAILTNDIPYILLWEPQLPAPVVLEQIRYPEDRAAEIFRRRRRLFLLVV